MKKNAKIGVVKRANGEIVVQYDGEQGDVFELLAVLNAKFLLDTTSTPAQYRDVFNRLQVETGRHYGVLIVDKAKRDAMTEHKDDFDFLS